MKVAIAAGAGSKNIEVETVQDALSEIAKVMLLGVNLDKLEIVATIEDAPFFQKRRRKNDAGVLA